MTKEIRTEVEIDASARKVWEVIANFAKYEEWNPFIRKVSGEAREGAKLEIHITTPSGVNRTYEPTVTKIEPEKELRWTGRVPGLLNGEHVFVIEQIDSSRVRLVHSETFRGLISSFFGSKTDRDIRAGLEQMNVALKKRVES